MNTCPDCHKRIGDAEWGIHTCTPVVTQQLTTIESKIFEDKAAQPAQQEPLSHDHEYALREGHQIGASDAYFKANPANDNEENRRLFERGYYRGWDAKDRLIERLKAQPAQEPVVKWDSDGWGDLLVPSLPDGTLLYAAPVALPAQDPNWTALREWWDSGSEEFERLQAVVREMFYTAPQQERKPLTKAEVDAIVLEHMPDISSAEGNPVQQLNAYRSLVRRGEAGRKT